MISVKTLLLGVLLFSFALGATQCIGENGKPVSWWIIIKYPILVGNVDKNAAAGYGYAYCDNNSPTLTPTGLGLNTNLGGSLGSTLNQVFNNVNSPNVAYVLYDDQWPNGTQKKFFRPHQRSSSI